VANKAAMRHCSNEVIVLAPGTNFRHLIIPNTRYEQQNLENQQTTILVRAGDTINDIIHRILVYFALCLSNKGAQRYFESHTAAVERNKQNRANAVQFFEHPDRRLHSTKRSKLELPSHVQKQPGDNDLTDADVVSHGSCANSSKQNCSTINSLGSMFKPHIRQSEVADDIRSGGSRRKIIFCVMTHGNRDNLILKDKFGNKTYINRISLFVSLNELSAVLGAESCLILDTSCRNGNLIALDEIVESDTSSKLDELISGPSSYIKEIISRRGKEFFDDCGHVQHSHMIMHLSTDGGSGYWATCINKSKGMLILTPAHAVLYGIFESYNFADKHKKIDENDFCLLCMFNIFQQEVFPLFKIAPTVTVLRTPEVEAFFNGHLKFIENDMPGLILHHRAYHNVRKVGVIEEDDTYDEIDYNDENPSTVTRRPGKIGYTPKSNKVLRQSCRYLPVANTLIKCANGCCYVPLVAHLQ